MTKQLKKLVNDIVIDDPEGKLIILRGPDVLPQDHLQYLATLVKERFKGKETCFLVMGKKDQAAIFSMKNGRLTSALDFDKKKFVKTLQKIIKQLEK